MDESFDEQLARVRLMSYGDDQWDLSPNDLDALTAVLSALDEARIAIIEGCKLCQSSTRDLMCSDRCPSYPYLTGNPPPQGRRSEMNRLEKAREVLAALRVTDSEWTEAALEVIAALETALAERTGDFDGATEDATRCRVERDEAREEVARLRERCADLASCEATALDQLKEARESARTAWEREHEKDNAYQKALDERDEARDRTKELEQAVSVTAQTVKNKELELREAREELSAAEDVGDRQRQRAKKAEAERDAHFAALTEAREEVAQYQRTFRHTHVAKYDGDRPLDACGKCGLDIRDEVHERAAETETDNVAS